MSADLMAFKRQPLDYQCTAGLVYIVCGFSSGVLWDLIMSCDADPGVFFEGEVFVEHAAGLL